MLKHTISNSFKLTSYVNSDIVYIYSDIRTIFLGLQTHVGLLNLKYFENTIF